MNQHGTRGAVSSAFGWSILASFAISVFGCAALERNRIQSDFRDCMAPLDHESRYAAAKEILDPEGGVTPSMLADHSFPAPEKRVIFSDYLDEKTRCERRLLQETGAATYGDKEKFHVMRKHYHARWESYANFLSGSMTYGEFFAEQESITNAKDDRIAEIERRRQYAVSQRKASVEEACASAGGKWSGVRCNPELGDPDRRISCTTNESMTTCTSIR
jgi:hypothetical protein